MIPVDLSANCEGWIYDPKGSGIQMLGIRSRDPFSGSTDMSVRLCFIFCYFIPALHSFILGFSITHGYWLTWFIFSYSFIHSFIHSFMYVSCLVRLLAHCAVFFVLFYHPFFCLFIHSLNQSFSVPESFHSFVRSHPPHSPCNTSPPLPAAVRRVHGPEHDGRRHRL